MNDSASTSTLGKAHQLVGAVVSILEKLHGEGFLAPGVFVNLGLTKIKEVLRQPPSQERLQELQGFVVKIDALFATRQLLHASATEKFLALFSGYLQAALQACKEADNTRPSGSTLH